MQALIEVILPVFLVVGFGYVAALFKLFSAAGVDGLMKFTQGFAIPCLLFRAISTLDLSQNFNLPLLFTFYTGATAGFLLGLFGARFLFGRNWQDSVAIGFCCLFSNSVLLGLPITERAFGASALAGNYAIVALHAPFCYAFGITAMELVRGRGQGLFRAIWTVLRSLTTNPLVIGITAGFAVNLTGIAPPMILTDAIDMMIRAALPAALFGLGGILVRYRPQGDMRVILYVCTISLFVHPAIVWGLGHELKLDEAALRSALITAAMAPGINAYVFASLYGRAERVAASAVLMATGLSILSGWWWLTVLGS